MLEPLSDNDIEAELSYAYLHAVASRAGINCQWLNRHSDNRGVDAMITAYPPDSELLDEVSVNIQLKATFQTLAESVKGYLSYSSLKVSQYEDLRKKLQIPRILIIMHLPAKKEEWLNISAEALVLKNCAYWVSLHNAPKAPDDQDTTTVYVPKSQLLTVDSLINLTNEVAENPLNSNILRYHNPKLKS